MGYADRVLEKELGRELDAAFSVLMPDVYICLPGFDVDSEEECREKFTMEKKMVKDIVACVSERKSLRRLKRGPFPWLKSYAIRPLFNRYLVTDKYFNVDVSRCVSCKKCINMCLVGNIVMKDDLPQWQSDCSGCLACYHACPHHAINFGKMTQKKGQYTLPKDL
jgi:NAD-dependent dihydropyrimidine dehydrogenase PreA subunit